MAAARVRIREMRMLMTQAEWARLFNKIFAELAGTAGQPDRVMIDATHLKAHRTAVSLLKKGLFPDVSGVPRAG